MIPQTITAILLAIPLLIMVVISGSCWIDYKDISNGRKVKQYIQYNKFFLYLVGLGYFCIWPFWIIGLFFLFLNKYYSVFDFMVFSTSYGLAIQVIGFLVFFIGTMMLSWALNVAGK